MYFKALKLAYNAHNGQVRRESNVPYIVHCLRISNSFNDELRKTISILHDIVEDTCITLEDLKEMFPSKVVRCVDSLSRREDEQYFDYIERLQKNEIAIEIKIVDVVDNLSDTLTVQPRSMIERYDKTLKLLLS